MPQGTVGTEGLHRARAKHARKVLEFLPTLKRQALATRVPCQQLARQEEAARPPLHVFEVVVHWVGGLVSSLRCDSQIDSNCSRNRGVTGLSFDLRFQCVEFLLSIGCFAGSFALVLWLLRRCL